MRYQNSHWDRISHIWYLEHDVGTRTCLRAFLDHPTIVEILRCRISPTGSPPLCCRDFTLSEPQSVPLMGFPPLGAGKPTSSSHLNLRADEYIRIPLWNFPHSRDSSVDGKPPHERTTPLLGMFLHLRYRIVDWVGAPIWNRRIQAVVGISPTSDQLSCKCYMTMAMHGIKYFHEGFLIWIISSTYRSREVIRPMIL